MNAAVIGCGRAGFLYALDRKRAGINTHLSAYLKSEKILKVFAADCNKAALQLVKEYYPDIVCYIDYKTMLAKQNIDILSIATPDNLRYDIIKFAAENNVKGIFCEKPISKNLAEARKIIAICEKYKIKLAVNYFRRWDNMHIDLAYFLQCKKLGNIQSVIFSYTGGIINTGTHAFDLLSMFFGKIVSVKALRCTNYSRSDPSIDVVVNFDSGISASMIGNEKCDFRLFELNIVGTKGRIILNNGYNADYFLSIKSNNNSEFNVLKKQEALFKNGRRGYFENAVNNLYNAINFNEKLLCDGKDGLDSLSCSMATIESYLSNKKIDILTFDTL